MNKSELIAAVAKESSLTVKDSTAAVNAVLKVLSETVVKGETIQLIGFGSFELRERAARTGINPATKEKISIPASKAVTFKAGKALKEAANK